jgi:hypothetical protein
MYPFTTSTSIGNFAPADFAVAIPATKSAQIIKQATVGFIFFAVSLIFRATLRRAGAIAP